ncbi:MAG: CcmD family protein [Candidatus Kapaibacteriota bacterium]
MVDFLVKNQLYIVLIIALIIWLGLLYYLFYLDRKVTYIENKTNIISNKSEDKQ